MHVRLFPDPLRTVDHDPAPEAPSTDATGAYQPDTRPTASAPPADAPSIPGYDLTAEIARGGMGRVYAGRDLTLDREVAIKTLLPGADAERFVTESKITARLPHPGIPPVHAMGRLADGTPYLAMKLIRGRTLADHLKERPSPLHELPRFVQTFEQIAQAVGFAHAQGVIHRDLKPLNVMVGEFGEVQVMDWGLAKSLRTGRRDEVPISTGEVAAEQTQAGTVLGTYAYMPPEVASGHAAEADERGDVFGLGAILCQILTGMPPYAEAEGSSVRELALAADLGPALDRLARCGADEELTSLCRRCLAIAVEDRPRNANEVATAVAAYATGVAERLRAAEVERAAGAAREQSERGRRRMRLALLGTVVVVALAAVGIWSWLWVRQRTRLTQTASEVNQAIGRAQLLRERADGVKPATLVDWQQAETLRREAIAAGEQAEAAFAAGEPDAALREELDVLLSNLRAEAEAARRSRAMLARLIELRYDATDYIEDDDWDRCMKERGNSSNTMSPYRNNFAKYVEAFRDFGIDLETMTPEAAAAAIVREPLRAELVTGLDEWRGAAGGAEGKKTRNVLHRVAGLADPDRFRARLRETLEGKPTRTALRSLASAPEVEALPTGSLISLASALHQQKAPEEGNALLRRVHRSRSDDFLLNRMMGFLAMDHDGQDTPRHADAIRYFTAALASRPDCQRLRVDLGDAFGRCSAYREAEEAYRTALEKRPDWAFARNKLAGLLASAGRYEEALAESERALALRPQFAFIHSGRGDVLFWWGRYADAAAAYKEALRIIPGIAINYVRLGQALSEGGRFTEALEALREAVRLRPSAPHWASLANCLVKTGRFGEAQDAADRAIQAQPGSSVGHAALANVYSAKGQFVQAVESYRQAITLAPLDAALHWRLCRVQKDLKRTDQALISLDEALRLGPPKGPRRAIMLNERGLMLGDANDRFAAVRAFQEASSFAPTDPIILMNLADTARDLGRHQEAAEALQKAITLKPQWHDPRAKLIDLRVEQGRIADALALIGDAPGDQPEMLLRRARILLTQGKANEALTLVDPLTVGAKEKPSPRNSVLNWHVRGKALLQLGRLDEAVVAYDKALSGPSSGLMNYREAALEFGDALLAQARRDAGSKPEDQIRKMTARGLAYKAWGLRSRLDFAAALPLIREAVRLDPEPRKQTVLAQTLLDLHRPAEARVAIEAALKADPNEVSRLILLARCLMGQEDFTAAEKVLRPMLKGKEPLRVLHLLGAVLQQQGRFVAARDCFLRYNRWENRDSHVALAARIDLFASGKQTPSEQQLIHLAEACCWSGKPALGARWFREAIRGGKLPVTHSSWDLAIRSAARAGCGLDDGASLTAAERAGWQAEARAWLRQKVTAQLRRLSESDVKPVDVLGEMVRLLRKPTLACVRDAAEVMKLPDSERTAWSGLWAEAELLRQLAEARMGGDGGPTTKPMAAR